MSYTLVFNVMIKVRILNHDKQQDRKTRKPVLLLVRRIGQIGQEKMQKSERSLEQTLQLGVNVHKSA